MTDAVFTMQYQHLMQRAASSENQTLRRSTMKQTTLIVAIVTGLSLLGPSAQADE
jgi:hypothetical protein|tara:strand:- start:1467 stop:1631 length:165 start_codon:yes stop_codon:yes gene_type:complete